jgi:hypothetical protein
MGAPWLTSAVAAVATALEGLDLFVDVSYEAWIGADAYNKPTFDPPVVRKAIVQEGTRQIRTPGGEEIAVRACISFFEPILPNGASGRREPVDPRDRLTLPSGYTGQIVDNNGSQLLFESPTPLAAASRPLQVLWLR